MGPDSEFLRDRLLDGAFEDFFMRLSSPPIEDSELRLDREIFEGLWAEGEEFDEEGRRTMGSRATSEDDATRIDGDGDVGRESPER